MVEVLYESLENLLQGAAHIDYYLGQYEDQGILLHETAVFLEFETFDWDTHPNGIQRAEVPFILHTVSATNYDDSARITNAALGHMRLVQQLYLLLQGIRIGEVGAYTFEEINRVRTTTDHDLRVVIVTKTEYLLSVWDATATPPMISVQPNLNSSTTIT